MTILAVLSVHKFEEEPSIEPDLVKDSEKIEEEIDDVNDAYASDDYEDENENDNELGRNMSKNLNNVESDLVNTNQIDVNTSPSMKKKTVKLRKAIFSKQNTLLFFLAFFNYCKKNLYFDFLLDFPSLFLNTYKGFTLRFKSIDDNFVFITSFFLYFGNGATRIVWGALYDKLGFKILMIYNFVMIFILSSTFYFIIEIKPLVVIYVILVSSHAASPFTLIPSAIQQIFGIKYSNEIYGGTFYAFGISSVLGPVICKIIDPYSSKTNTPFMILYLTGTISSVAGLITLYFLKMKPYVYKYY